jgi:uncharacterized membrane protein (TIGR02234 family)
MKLRSRPGAAAAGSRPPASASRREYGLALAGTVLGAALLFIAGSRGWVTLSVPRSHPLPKLSRTVSGAHAQPLLTALGLVGLAAVVALLATRRLGRRIVGLLLAVTAVVVLIWLARDLGGMSSGRTQTLLSDGGPVVGVPAGARVLVDLHLVWVAVALAGAALLVLAGLAAAVRGPGWPAMGSRYDRPRQAAADTGRADGQDVEPAAVGEVASTRSPTADRRLWEALDRGEDPTVNDDSV